MPHFKIDAKTPIGDLKDKHLVVNCRTGETFAADTPDEAQSLAQQHQKESEEEARRGNN